MSAVLDDSTVDNEEPAASMDDTIRATYEEIQSRGESANDDPPEGETEAEARARDEKGRFAAKAETPAEPAEPVAEVEPVVAADPAEPVSTVPPELQKLGLRKEEAEAISKDPVALQAFMRRSEEMHRGIEQYRTKAQFGDQMERVIAPYAPILQQMGVTPEFAIQRLFQAETALRSANPAQKLQMFSQLARDYGVDLNNFAEQAASIPTVDPQVQNLQSQLAQMQSWVQQQNQAREWQERESLNSEISKFSSDPTNVHFEAVRSDMAGLLQAGLAPDLKTAYEKACYANPTIRAQLLADQQAKAVEASRAVANQKAREAKAAAAVNVTRRGSVPSAKAIGTMDDTIRETATKLGLIS